MRSFFPASTGPARPARPARPAPLALGAGLVALQGVIGVVVGIAFMIGGVTLSPQDPADAEMIGALFLAMGTGLLASARGLLRGRRVARAPALVWQLIMLGVGFSEAKDNLALAVPLIVVGGLTTYALFHPAANAGLED